MASLSNMFCIWRPTQCLTVSRNSFMLCELFQPQCIKPTLVFSGTYPACSERGWAIMTQTHSWALAKFQKELGMAWNGALRIETGSPDQFWWKLHTSGMAAESNMKFPSCLHNYKERLQNMNRSQKVCHKRPWTRHQSLKYTSSKLCLLQLQNIVLKEDNYGPWADGSHPVTRMSWMSSLRMRGGDLSTARL